MSYIIEFFNNIIRLFYIVYLINYPIKNRKKFNYELRTMIVAPHPDDEVFGCGALISRLVKLNNPPFVLILTGGGESHARCCIISKEKIIQKRRELTHKALKLLGLHDEHIIELNYPDTKISHVQDNKLEMERLKKIISNINPQLVIIPHQKDLWFDHVITSKIFKEIIPTSIEIWEYCVWLWYNPTWKGLDWENCVRLKMSKAEYYKKNNALRIYLKEQAPCGKAWSGKLPLLFLWAHKKRLELFFKV